MATKTKEIVKMTKDAWMMAGKALFGDDPLDWKFVCPACKHVQSIGDFKKYKDQGATFDTAYQQCIGRFNGSKNRAFGARPEGKQPCDYCATGLLNICPVIVVDGEKEIPVFDFYREQSFTAIGLAEEIKVFTAEYAENAEE